jgi:hypothetical protein
MRRSIVVFLVMAASILLFSGLSWGQCPGEPNDRGVCDSLHVEPYKYTGYSSYPSEVEIAIRITHDVPTAATDSLAGIVIPLCFTSSNAAANATIYPDSNMCGDSDLNRVLHNLLYDLNLSVFSDLPNMESPTEYNWMMDISSSGSGRAWETRILDLSNPGTFWFSVIATGIKNQRFWEGSRVLLATMTITIDDTTNICIDTCFWAPTGRLTFTNGDLEATTFIPRHSMPFCFKAGYSNDVREIQESDENRPTEFSMSQNYPNPFNPTTNIKFELPRTAHVRLDVFNIVGQKVKTLVDQKMDAGKYVADWNGKDEKGNSVSSGIYFYRMDAGDFSDIKKMLLVK